MKMPLLAALLLNTLFALPTLALDHSGALARLKTPEHQLSFSNSGTGTFKFGLCWWYSRFVRNAAYLAEYLESDPTPTGKEAREIIRSLIRFKKTVIPGYANLRDFSIDYKELIIKEAQKWLLRDSLLQQKWMRSLPYRSWEEDLKLRARTDAIVESFKANPRPIFIHLQMPGLINHSTLLVDYDVIPKGEYYKGGYHLFWIDSNFPGEVKRQLATYGVTTYVYSNSMSNYFTPYIGFEEDFDLIEAALN